MKILTVAGTRPEFIRLSSLVRLLDETCDHVFVNTGQNFEPYLSDIFFAELSIRKPNYSLEVSGPFAPALAELLPRIASVLERENPDGLVILGDTNSALSSLVAARMGIPIFHLEAGNRAYDRRVPEEINRRIVDHSSDYNLAYTNRGRENLLREGFHPETISVSGSPLPEVIKGVKSLVDSSQVTSRLGLTPDQFLLISSHRQETVNDPENLRKLFLSIGQLIEDSGLLAVLSCHPRLQTKIREFGVEVHPRIQLEDPFGYFDFLRLQKDAHITLSDSGTISEESAILGSRAITIRKSFERQEALQQGSMMLAGLDYELWKPLIHALRTSPKSTPPREYLEEDFSKRVLSFIVSKLV